MHPLPRRDEISADIDDDPRSIYFQASGLRRADPHGDPRASARRGRTVGPRSAAPRRAAHPVTVVQIPARIRRASRGRRRGTSSRWSRSSRARRCAPSAATAPSRSASRRRLLDHPSLARARFPRGAQDPSGPSRPAPGRRGGEEPRIRGRRANRSDALRARVRAPSLSDSARDPDGRGPVTDAKPADTARGSPFQRRRRLGAGRASALACPPPHPARGLSVSRELRGHSDGPARIPASSPCA
jgi:hypothetical protein